MTHAEAKLCGSGLNNLNLLGSIGVSTWHLLCVMCGQFGDVQGWVRCLFSRSYAPGVVLPGGTLTNTVM